jgi:hypothetical protein
VMEQTHTVGFGVTHADERFMLLDHRIIVSS